MATDAQIRAQARYDKAHTQQIVFKLNRTTYADILAKLKDVENRQGYVKELIRKDIRGSSPILSLDAIRYLVCPVAKKYNLHTIYIFGSYARGEAAPDSDVDLMIDGDDIGNAGRYFSIVREFQEALGKEADVVMEKAARSSRSRASERFLSHFERDKILIYERV